MSAKADTLPLGPLLQRYFLLYLKGQRNLSHQTVCAYRDTFRLLLRFLARRYRVSAETVTVADLSVQRITAFLADLEESRGNCVRSRNVRLAALRSFMRYAASDEPSLLAVAQPILGIPAKRHDRRIISHLTREQMQALLNASADKARSGQRDQILLLLLYNTGARVSELASLRVRDVDLDSNASVRIQGKGRKQRSVPLWQQTVRLLQSWLSRPNLNPDSPLVPNARGQPMTRYGVAQRLRRIVNKASKMNPALRRERITPHVIRHCTAMHLLQSGVDLSVIALWLGHESIQTTHGYLAADLETKKQALACLKHPRVRRTRVGPVPIISFLESL
jgi:integrase/recombinase XerD